MLSQNRNRGTRQKRAGGAELSAALTLLLITFTQAQSQSGQPLVACGCPGWEFAPLSFANGAGLTPVSDCSGCQMPAAVSLREGAYLTLGSLSYDDTGVTYVLWLYSAFQTAGQKSAIFDFGNALDGTGGNASNGAGDNNHRLKLDNEGFLTFTALSGGQSSDPLVDGESFPQETWVHVAVTIDQSIGRLYRDGREVAAGPVPNLKFQERGNCLIGAANSVDTSTWQGDISDFRMYGRALSASEVSDVKLGTFADDSSLLGGTGFPSCPSYLPFCSPQIGFVFVEVMPDSPRECLVPPSDCAFACMQQNLTLIPGLNRGPVFHPDGGGLSVNDPEYYEYYQSPRFCLHCPDVEGQSTSSGQMVAVIDNVYDMVGTLFEESSEALIEISGIAPNLPCKLKYQVVGRWGDEPQETRPDAWCEENHYLHNLPTCQLDMKWDHAMTDMFRNRYAWAGGLGRMTSPDKDYETWVCVFGHPCLMQSRTPTVDYGYGYYNYGNYPPPGYFSNTGSQFAGSGFNYGSGFGFPSGAGFMGGSLVSEDACRPDLDWMCFVYSEHRNVFCPWAPDSALRLLNETQRSAPWMMGTFPQPLPGCLGDNWSPSSQRSFSPSGSGSAPGSGGGVPSGAVLCPGQAASDYCDCDGDCTSQPQWCACAEAQACCFPSPTSPMSAKAPSLPSSFSPTGAGSAGGSGGGLPPGAVLCPGQAASDYCDCGGDCTSQPQWCTCAEAQACCIRLEQPQP